MNLPAEPPEALCQAHNYQQILPRLPGNYIAFAGYENSGEFHHTRLSGPKCRQALL